MTDNDPVQMRCSQKAKQRRIPIWTDRRAEARLEKIKARYAELLERPVSNSLVVRRALVLLERQLATIADDEGAARELAALCFHVR